MEKVFAVLINYETAIYTRECIESLVQSKQCDLEIIVVDNSTSAEGYAQLQKEIAPYAVTLIKAPENLGFSNGNNIGIQYALAHGADYILMLNNDTVIDENMIAELLQKADNKTVTVPKMYYHANPTVLWYAGGEIQWKFGKTAHIGENQEDCEIYSQEKEVAFATGCCLLLHKKVIEQVGLWDESFFMYGEDVDYSIRLAQNGIKILYVPTAKLWHKVGASAGIVSALGIYYDNRNRFFLIKKYNYPLRGWLYTVGTRFIRFLVAPFQRNSNQKYVLNAWRDYRKGVRGKVDFV